MNERKYADARERNRAKKRRNRDRRRARGLNALGRPVRFLALVDGGLVASGRCPTGCSCRDCLFPPLPYEPRVMVAHAPEGEG